MHIHHLKRHGIAFSIAEGIGEVTGAVVTTVATGGAVNPVVLAGLSKGGQAVGKSWEQAKNSSFVGIKEQYEKGEIDKQTFKTIQTVRNMTNKEWKQFLKSSNLSQKEQRQLKQYRDMPEDWRNVKNTIRGIAYGAAIGAWESAQWYLGGKLGEVAIKKGASKVANSALRVGIDTAVNALDTPYRVVMDSLTTDKTLKQAWKEQGGWKTVLSDVGIGLIGSIGGEISFSKVNNKKIELAKTDIEKEIKVNKFQEFILENGKAFEGVDDETTNKVLKDLEQKYLTGKINLQKVDIKQVIETNKAIKQANVNKIDLVEATIKDMPPNLNDIEKARRIYLKLNEQLIYSDEWLAMTEKGKNVYNEKYRKEIENLYNCKFDVSDVKNNKVVCSTWSKMYKELLEKAGIEANRIQIMGTEGKLGVHRYIKIDLGNDRILLADATNNITGGTDLARAKVGDTNTAGFIYTTNREFERVKEKCTNMVLTFAELGNNSKLKEFMKKVDENIGYNDVQYKNDMNAVLDLYNKVGRVDVEDKLGAFCKVFDNMGTIESYPIIQRKLDNFFDNASVDYYVKNDKSISVVTIRDISTQPVYLYKINGKPFVLANETEIKEIIEGAD